MPIDTDDGHLGEAPDDSAELPWRPWVRRDNLCPMTPPAETTPPDGDAPLLEVCCASADFAAAAEAAGADRVELCSDLVEGGTTPSAGAIALAVERLRIPVMVMIRPRGGDFLYSSLEHEVMLRDIETARALGAYGVVIGVLTADGAVDRARTIDLAAAAEGMSVTFHRAFDVSRDLEDSLETLAEVGVDRVLTSAGRSAVVDDLPTLERLASLAGERIRVLACGGIRAHNVGSVLAVPGVREVHVGATRWEESPMAHRVMDVPMGRAYEPDEYVREVADTEMISGVGDAMRGRG